LLILLKHMKALKATSLNIFLIWMSDGQQEAVTATLLMLTCSLLYVRIKERRQHQCGDAVLKSVSNDS
jgi:hypothetical protein